MSSRLGVCIIGSNGAVASTVIAGVALMRKGLAPRNGMVTETELGRRLPLAPVDGLVFGGWDLLPGSTYEAAVRHRVIPRPLLDAVKDELDEIHPWPAVFSPHFLTALTGKNTIAADGFRAEIEMLEEHIAAFRRKHDLDRLVLVNLTSTEKFCEVGEVHRSLKAFEAGLDASDPRISPAMKYLYLSCKLGIPHVNFTPSLTKVPALEDLAVRSGVPIAGEDGKTGQTMLKTALAPAFVVRQLKVDGWFSTNILGNNDGLVLNDPAANKTKVTSKKSGLDSILGYNVPSHQVHIHYYRPRGDDKEAWDNIDLEGFLGERMQLKVNFLCKDSILAAPLVIDLARLIDFASVQGERGVQRQLSVFFKAPYYSPGETPVHDLFKQYAMLEEWAARVPSQKGGKRAAEGAKHG